MQTLGISESTPRSENWLKSLFWPSITSGADVDYLGAQGYWICAIVAVISFLVSLVTQHPIVAVVALLFYFFGGVGVRERSIYAAAVVLSMYLLDMLFGGVSVMRVLFSALLLSNLRATIVAYGWDPGSSEAELPARLGDTWTQKFSDRLPLWLWPKIRILYYIYSGAVLLVTAVGVVLVLSRRV